MTLDTLLPLTIVELFGAAEHLKASGRGDEVVDFYKGWIACHPTDPTLYAAYFNYGTALSEAGDIAGAVIALREATRLQPSFHPARISLGLLQEKLGQSGEAVLTWLAVSDELMAITPDALSHKIMALENTGRLLETLEQDTQAEQALRERLELGFDDKVVQHWVALRMRQCKWPVLEGGERLNRRDVLAGLSPLSLASLEDDPLFQLGKAGHYCNTLLGPPNTRPALPAPPPGRPKAVLRIGYVSSDLREHAVGFSLADLMEVHDRSAVEVFAYYCGIERDDPTRRRIKAGVDRWQELNGLDDEAAARLIRADNIDILVDLNGYTKDARTAVFARRPAPIAVNWFGFPATMGSSFHHYLIADPHTVPPGSEPYYSERVVRLACYQPNDRRRTVSAAPPSRAAEGLPDGAVVFCCLNGLHKLTEATFESWLRILAGVPGSVLWLLGGTADTQERLRAHAALRGLQPERLVFAPKRLNPEHVARYALADLFLDNAPYGAHTTAADALWMGVPVLTCPGRSFASRVCASLVHAAGLPELVCVTPADYEARAVALGVDAQALHALKARLRAGRDTCLLFDTPRLARDLEALYRAMWTDWCENRLPRPDLLPLQAYHEVGLAGDLGDAAGLDETQYRARYAAGLAAWTGAPQHEPW